MIKASKIQPFVSLVVPCYNEVENIEVIHVAIITVLKDIAKYELIFVDDGSTDKTLFKIKELSEKYSYITYLSFSRNFGHQSALKAGIDVARGEVVIMMDADMQHPPQLLPKLIEKWQQGYEVVNTIRKKDKQLSFFKRKTSNWFYKVMTFLTNINLHQGMADFRLLDKKVVDIIRGSKEDELFLRGMIGWVGFKQAYLEYTPNSRYAGDTKYSLRKMISFAILGITSFTIRPLRFSILLAGLFILLSIFEIAYVLYTFFFSHSVSGWASLALLISILGAMTLLMIGVIGEYIGRIFLQVKGRPSYVITETNYNLNKHKTTN